MATETRGDKASDGRKQAAGPPAPQAAKPPREDERFRIISELTSDFAYSFTVTPDGGLELEWMTDAFAHITGYQPDEIWPAGNWMVLIHPEDKARVQERLHYVLTGHDDSGEARLVARDGTVRWLHIHTQSVWDPDQERIVRVYGAVRDITARKQAEAALRESEERYRTLAESALDAIFIIDREGRFEYVNEAGARLLGHTPEEVVGCFPEEFVDPGAYEQRRRNLESVLESGRPAVFLTDTQIGERQIWQETWLMPLQGEDGEVRAVMGISRDVTDGVHVQEALRESEERYRTLAESSPDAIYIISREGLVEYINRAAAKMIGRQAADIVGRPPEECFARDTFSRQEQNLQEIFRSGQPLAVEDLSVIGGREIWQDSLLVPLKDKDGGVRAIMGVSRDITARKKAEEALRESEERYRIVSELTSDFAFAVRIEEDTVALEWITEAIARITGLTMDEIRARGSWRRFIHPEDLSLIRDLLADLRRGQAIERQVRLITKAGQTRWVQGYAVPFRDPDTGQVVHIYGAAQDITEQEAAAQALQQSEYQYRTTINAMRHLIHVIDPNFRLSLCNTAMLEWLEEAQMDTAVIGRTVFEAFPFLPESIRDEYQRVFETGNMLVTEERTVIGAQELITETRKIPILEKDSVVQVITVVHDITQRKRAEQSLRESEERYRAVVEDQTELICRFQPDWTLTFVNEAYCRYFSKRRDELLGQSFMDLIPPEDHPQVKRQIALLGRERPVVTYEDRALLPSGEIRWQQWTDRAIFDERGRLVEFQSVGRDITQRKRAEAALQESEARYRALVETSPDSITLTDLEGRILVANQRAAQVYGAVSTEELVGMSALELIAPADRAIAAANMQRTLESGFLRGVEYSLLRKDGTPYPVELSASLLRDAQGQPQGFIGMTRDITKRKQAEQILWQTKMVVEHSPVILYQIRNEPGWPVEFVSENVKMSGYTSKDLLSGQITLTMLVHPDDLPQVLGEMEEHAEHGPDAFRRSYRVVLRNERVAWVEDRMVVVRASDGQATHFQGILLDITENRRLEEQFRQAQKMETVGRLAGGIAHDFNNFLTAIRGYTGLVYDALRPEDPVRDDVEQVLQAAERAASLTGQLLAFSRRQIIEPRPINLNDLVIETEKMLHRLIGEDIDLVLDLTSSLGLTRADPGQITQAAVNLVINARDAMPDGGVLTIATANLHLDQDGTDVHSGVPVGHYVTLTVSDTGMGMSPEVKAHLFEPFFTTKEPGRGTGLGLATVYGIVQQHQGHVNVQSEAGCGTKVCIYLSYLQEKVRPAPRHRSVKPSPRGGETLLVVEDEPVVRALMVRVLRGLGYNVLEANEGNAAIQVARAHKGKIQLLLTDVVMPQMDGKILASLLQDVYQDLRVLYVSGYATDVLSRYGVLKRGVSLLHKPFTGAELAHKVREVLDKDLEETEKKGQTDVAV